MTRQKPQSLCPREDKTDQSHILAYAQEIGWSYVLRADVEAQLGFDLDQDTREADMLRHLMTAQIRVHDIDVPKSVFSYST